MDEQTAPSPLFVAECGTLDFDVALEIQQRLVDVKLSGDPCDYLLMTRHAPVVTLGRSSDADDTAAAGGLVRLGIPVRSVTRGGRATYHGPGQIVGYPVVALLGARRDLHAYLKLLECAIVSALRNRAVPACTRPGKTGVWVEGKKVASIGVAVRSWIAYHGFSINLTPDALPPDGLSPCGMAPETVGCLQDLGFDSSPGPYLRALGHAVAEHLGMQSVETTLQDVLTKFRKSGMMGIPTTIGGR